MIHIKGGNTFVHFNKLINRESLIYSHSVLFFFCVLLCILLCIAAAAALLCFSKEIQTSVVCLFCRSHLKIQIKEAILKKSRCLPLFRLVLFLLHSLPFCSFPAAFLLNPQGSFPHLGERGGGLLWSRYRVPPFQTRAWLLRLPAEPDGGIWDGKESVLLWKQHQPECIRSPQLNLDRRLQGTFHVNGHRDLYVENPPQLRVCVVFLFSSVFVPLFHVTSHVGVRVSLWIVNVIFSLKKVLKEGEKLNKYFYICFFTC